MGTASSIKGLFRTLLLCLILFGTFILATSSAFAIVCGAPTAANCADITNEQDCNNGFTAATSCVWQGFPSPGSCIEDEVCTVPDSCASVGFGTSCQPANPVVCQGETFNCGMEDSGLFVTYGSDLGQKDCGSGQTCCNYALPNFGFCGEFGGAPIPDPSLPPFACNPGDKTFTPCGITDVGECSLGQKEAECQSDGTWGPWGLCLNEVGPAIEICGNGLDEDCSGADLSCPRCGDGIINGLDACDLGDARNGAPGEFCSAACQVVTSSAQLDSVLVCTQNFVCGDADGICPDDFAALGTTCEAGGVRDVDCMRGDIAVLFDDSFQVGIIDSAVNDAGAEVTSIDAQYDNQYVATVTIDGAPSASSWTTINFAQDPGILSTVLFDSQTIYDCGVSSQPCFTYDEGNSQLQVQHALSVHVVQAIFRTRELPWLPYFIIVAIIALLPIAVYTAKRQQYYADLEMHKDQLEHQVSLPHDALTKLEKYIEKKLKEGVSQKKIKVALLDVGWDPHVIDLVLHRHHNPHQDVGRLKIFAHKMQEKGRPKSEIKSLLRKQGWSSKDIEEAIKSLD